MWNYMYVFERHFDVDDQKNVIIEPLVDCHDSGEIVSREPNMHSGSFNNADVSFNTFYIKTENR